MNILIRAVALLALLCYPAYSHERSSSDDGGFSISFGSISYKELGELNGGVLTIKDRVNLQNKQCVIPEGITLCFKGGLIQNGTLVGNMTKLKTCGVCFNRVKILGTWNVPCIKSSFFYDLSYENALKDVVALSNPNIKNRISIDEGNYLVAAYKNADICIPINSNTEFILNGTINLLPNEYTNYYIIQATGSNIKIKGKGTIVGDKFSHTGKTGEWGMGINLHQAHHVSISDLTIKDCWGDCIYVGGNSSDVTITNCHLDNGRRQGISITSANGVKIKDCTITNVYGTAPEYAIDVEPNKGETTDNIIINDVTVNNCRGGFLAYGKAPKAKIGDIEIKRCSISGTRKTPIELSRCASAKVEKCTITDWNQKKAIHHEEIGVAKIKKIIVK